MLYQIREGDTIAVSELSRAIINVRELFSMVNQVHEKGANIKSLKEIRQDNGLKKDSQLPGQDGVKVVDQALIPKKFNFP